MDGGDRPPKADNSTSIMVIKGSPLCDRDCLSRRVRTSWSRRYYELVACGKADHAPLPHAANDKRTDSPRATWDFCSNVPKFAVSDHYPDVSPETLRKEAVALLEQSALEKTLRARFGAAALVGSADLDLMTWRDIDLSVRVEVPERADMLAILPELDRGLAGAGHTLLKAVFNDEWALPRGDYGSGYYWGLRTRSREGHVWKIDIWGWDGATYERKIEEHVRLLHSLSRVSRDLILRLKTEAQALPEFRKTITSWNIYRFVLAGRGSSLDELRTYLSAGR